MVFTYSAQNKGIDAIFLYRKFYAKVRKVEKYRKHSTQAGMAAEQQGSNAAMQQNSKQQGSSATQSSAKLKF